MKDYELTRDELKQLRREFFKQGQGHWGDYVAYAQRKKMLDYLQANGEWAENWDTPSEEPMQFDWIIPGHIWQALQEAHKDEP